MKQVGATLLVLAMSAASAEALPVLRLVLTGDARSLATGAGDPFARPDVEAFQLARPALLSDDRRGSFVTRLDSETTVAIEGTHAFAGTRAADTRARSTWVQPFTMGGERLVFALSGRFEDGSMRVRNARDGVLFGLTERRAATQAALAWRALPWLRLGGSVGLGLGRAYAIEMVANVGVFEFGFVQRAEQLRWGIDSPAGPARKYQRPALWYDIDQTRQSAVFSGVFRTRYFAARGAWDALQPDDLQLESDVFLGSHLRLRGRWETTRYAFDNEARTGGETVATVDLGVHHSRWTLGADANFGAHRFVLRRMSSTIATASAWRDNGETTGQKLFSLQADFGLYLRHLYRAQVDQWSGGWSREGTKWSVALGAQHLAATNAAGGVVYGSAATDELSGSKEVKPAAAKAIGVTGGLGYRLGATSVRLGAAQLVPYAGSEEADPAKPAPPPDPNPPPAPPPSAAAKSLAKKAASFDGGRLLVIELERSF